ncbi:MAG: hypothetical protein OEX76_04675 [Candidatus Bathyarchaeota archaeon]|nr:hypothetical protein [Candidatus Bathyarchaeota archaeon]MDH5532070.1 hypothetical protein [Candidatus Bathyarchaeota archaeon]MDH5713027.1 hypothetical protein [Candidatus Bathyarchaeota archaeon]
MASGTFIVQNTTVQEFCSWIELMMENLGWPVKKLVETTSW